MLIQHDQPKLFHTILERRLVCTQKIMEARAAVGIHAVYVEEVLTGAEMISPNAYEETIWAYNQLLSAHERPGPAADPLCLRRRGLAP